MSKASSNSGAKGPGDLPSLTLAEARDALRKKEITATELTNRWIVRIALEESTL